MGSSRTREAGGDCHGRGRELKMSEKKIKYKLPQKVRSESKKKLTSKNFARV